MVKEMVTEMNVGERQINSYSLGLVDALRACYEVQHTTTLLCLHSYVCGG
jgi:hypothetical protein